MKRALALITLAACASAAPRPASAIAKASAAIDAAPAGPAPRACLPELDAPVITHLDGDDRTVRVCFARNVCFAIDRVTSGATASPNLMPNPLATSRAPGPITITKQRYLKDRYVHANVCAGGDCITVRAPLFGPIEHTTMGIRDDEGKRVVAWSVDSGGTPAFTLVEENGWTVSIHAGSVGRCSVASWAGPDVLVTNDDCEGNVRGVLYGHDGKRVADVGGAHALDTRGAFAVNGFGVWAIIVPRAYAAVLVDLPDAHRQEVVDLVPIQAEATADPHFAAISLANGDWIVASPSGGVGLIDHASHALAKTWIIPRCEAAP